MVAFSTHSIRPRWVASAPFGSPVVPEVNMRLKKSLSETTGSSPGGPRSSEASARPASAAPSTSTRAKSSCPSAAAVWRTIGDCAVVVKITRGRACPRIAPTSKAL